MKLSLNCIFSLIMLIDKSMFTLELKVTIAAFTCSNQNNQRVVKLINQTKNVKQNRRNDGPKEINLVPRFTIVIKCQFNAQENSYLFPSQMYFSYFSFPSYYFYLSVPNFFIWGKQFSSIIQEMKIAFGKVNLVRFIYLYSKICLHIHEK